MIGAALFILAAYLDGTQIAQQTGKTNAALSVGQIGMITFGVLLFVYGAIGSISVWLEGQELRPGLIRKSPGTFPVIAGVILSALLVALAGFFVRLIYHELAAGITASALEGAIAGTIFLVAAFLLLLYRKAFVDDEALVEDEHMEVPW